MHGGAGSNEPSPSRVASPAGSVAHHSLASSHARTPSLGTNIVRSHSNSASSHGSQTTELKLQARSGNECGEDSKSICQDDSKTNEEGRDDYEDEAPKGEGEGEDTDTKSSKESGSNTGESSSQSSHSSLETDVEIQAHVVLPAKETQGDASAKEDKANDLKSPCPPPQSNINDKDSEKEQKCQHHKDARLLDKNFSVWHAHMIGEGHTD